MNLKHPHLYFILFLGTAASAALLLFSQWHATVSAQEIYSILRADVHTPLREIQKKPARQTVKGVYLTAYSAGNPKKMQEIFALLNRTELNAVVIDIKDYSGKILYDSNLLLVNELKTEDNRIGDLASLIRQLHEADVYVILRQTVFQDPILAQKKPDWAIHAKGGGIWRDNNGLSWVDPTEEAVWRYNLAIAKEVIRMGADEINFDYVRFPSDGNLKNVVYTNGNRERHDVMRDFFQFLSDELSSEPVWISLDFFGFVMERHDGMSIGQRLEDATDAVDYISPMMYPSHYPNGHLGFANPAERPVAVIENGMKKGMPYFDGTRARVRPWIQAFNLGAVYDAAKIRGQIDAVEKYTDAGWLLWNAGNKYSEAGLHIEN